MMKYIKSFIRRHIVDDFPKYYNSECFVCDRTECKDCPYVDVNYMPPWPDRKATPL